MATLLEVPAQDLPVVEPPHDQFQIASEPLALADKLLEVARLMTPSPERDKVLIRVANLLNGKNIF